MKGMKIERAPYILNVGLIHVCQSIQNCQGVFHSGFCYSVLRPQHGFLISVKRPHNKAYALIWQIIAQRADGIHAWLNKTEYKKQVESIFFKFTSEISPNTNTNKKLKFKWCMPSQLVAYFSKEDMSYKIINSKKKLKRILMLNFSTEHSSIHIFFCFYADTVKDKKKQDSKAQKEYFDILY